MHKRNCDTHLYIVFALVDGDELNTLHHFRNTGVVLNDMQTGTVVSVSGQLTLASEIKTE